MAEVDLVDDTLDLAELGNDLESVRLAADRYHDMLSAFSQADTAEDCYCQRSATCTTSTVNCHPSNRKRRRAGHRNA